MKTLKKVATASALSLAIAAPVAAEEHIVVLTGFTYFPNVTYADPGDTIRFVNESGEEETVVGRDTGWTVGPLADNEEGTLVITEETELAFFSAYTPASGGEASTDDPDATDVIGDNFGTYEDADITAEISFEDPPQNN
ncbi:MAG: hypothetical protein ABJL99_23620 [Aliishimia sp.]